MTLGHRVQLLLVAFFVLLSLNAALAIGDIRARDAALEELQRLEPAHQLATDLTTYLVDQETGQRGFVITRDERFLEPYDDGVAVTRATLAQLRAMFEDDPEVLIRVDRVEASWERWRRQAAEPELAAVRAGEGSRVVDLVASRHGLRLFDLLRADARALRAEVDGRVLDLDTRLQTLRGRLTTTLVASFFVGLALLLVAAVLLRRWIAAPFTAVVAAARRVADGELDHEIPPVGPRDLAALGTAVDRMRRRIVSQLETQVRAREALEQQGPAVVTLRSELAPTPLPLPDTISFAGRLVPAEGLLAGDWYDLVPLPDGRVMLSVVDVSGHGSAAGVFALRAKSLLLAALRQGLDPGAALGWMAEQLGDTGETALTGVVVEVDPGGRACYASAGHPPPLLSTVHGVTTLEPTGPLLGPLPGAWTTEPFDLPPSGLLVVYTDGLVEARDAGRREFGLGRLRRLVAVHDGARLDAFVDRCVDQVREFVGDRFADDVTIVALSRRDGG